MGADARTTSTTPISLLALRELAPATGRVCSVSLGKDDTLLRVAYPRGLQLVVSVPAVPGWILANNWGLLAIRRPLAVRLSNKPTGLDCSVLGTSRTGPRRIRISTAQALSLCVSGVHAVLCTD